MSQARIAHWETGRGNPAWESRALRQALASALELDINEMMASLGFVDADEETSQEARRAAYIIDRLPEPERSIALDFLELLDKKVRSKSS